MLEAADAAIDSWTLERIEPTEDDSGEGDPPLTVIGQTAEHQAAPLGQKVTVTRVVLDARESPSES